MDCQITDHMRMFMVNININFLMEDSDNFVINDLKEQTDFL